MARIGTSRCGVLGVAAGVLLVVSCGGSPADQGNQGGQGAGAQAGSGGGDAAGAATNAGTAGTDAGSDGGAAAGGAPGQPAGGGVAELAAGDGFTCAREGQGRVTCWGRNALGNLAAPSHVFTSMDLGPEQGCGIRGDGQLACWGSETIFDEPLIAPEGAFKSISTADQVACGVKADGSLTCFGPRAASSELDAVPAGAFESVCASDGSACAISPEGTLTCWGYPVDAPAGSFSQCALSGGAGSAIRSDGKLVYFSSLGGVQESELSYSMVDASGRGFCALNSEGNATCYETWNDDDLFGASPSGPFVEITAGENHACARRATGDVACWGNPSSPAALEAPAHLGEPALSEPPRRRLTAGAAGICAIKEGGWLGCWRRHFDDPTRPGWFRIPAGNFVDVSAGWPLCGLRPDGTVACFDHEDEVVDRVPTDATFVSLHGGRFTCGMKADGSVACWAANDLALGTPDGAFEQIAVGSNTACGIRPGGSLECWGTQPPTDVPAGSFTRVAVGTYTSCAQRADGGWVCFGSNEACDSSTDVAGFCAEAPSTQPVDFAYQEGNGCVLDANGALTCWPASAWTELPAGSFAAVALIPNAGCVATDATEVSCFARTGATLSLLPVPYGF